MSPPVRRLAFASVIDRRLLVVLCVLLLHALFLWSLQKVLPQQPAKLVVPIQMLGLLVAVPPQPAPVIEPVVDPVIEPVIEPVAPPPVQPVVKPKPKPKPKPKVEPVLQPTPKPVPEPVFEAAPEPSTTDEVEVTTASATQPEQPVQPEAQSTSAASGEPASVAGEVEAPSSNADYLNNPKPQYPLMSRRLGEQGLVVCNVLIGVDGVPLEAKVVRSSGFARLDQAALAAVLSWRYTPGKRNGVAVVMSVDVPIEWELKNF